METEEIVLCLLSGSKLQIPLPIGRRDKDYRVQLKSERRKKKRREYDGFSVPPSDLSTAALST